MNILLLGNCDKYDLSLSLAYLISLHSNKSVCVVTDNNTFYHYFNGDTQDIKILSHRQSTEGFEIVIYDYYNNNLPKDVSFDKTIIITDCSRLSVCLAEEFYEQLKTDFVIFLSVECSINQKFIRNKLQGTYELLEIPDEVSRRIELVHDGVINFKKLAVDRDFLSGLADILTYLIGTTSKESKTIIDYAKKLK
jgi:hypothetical protein